MNHTKKPPERKRLRLPEYDYSTPGAYFVTFCTQERRCILSEITVGDGLAHPVLRLFPAGECVKEQIEAVQTRYPSVQIEKSVIMPNHVHLIVMLHADAGGASPSPTLADVVRVIKSISARQYGTPLWQRSYHEHVIRNEHDYLEIWTYMENNPARWARDCYYAASDNLT